MFLASLSPIEKTAFEAMREVITNFLGNKKAENYRELVYAMIEAFRAMGARMSSKLHFFHAHFDFFPDNLGALSDEHGERFHQEIAAIEERFEGKDYSHMLGEYCWSICRTASKYEPPRKPAKMSFTVKPPK